MKNYPHIIAKVFGEPWLITREKFQAIEAILLARLEKESEGAIAKPKAQEDDEDAKDKTEDGGPKMIVEDGTAIIPVHGIIGKHLDWMEMMSGGVDLDTVNAMTDAAQADGSVNRILYDFRSPGGTVTGIPEMGRKMYRSKKKTVAYTDSEANSGALWLATQAHEFYATSSSRVGSIGVWTASLDISRRMENDGVRMNAVSAGKYKLLGAYWKPMTDEERAVLQARVDSIHDAFKGAVNTRREVETKYMEGQIFDGEEAARIGLVDGLVDDISELF
jgi:signal peptide peptidase SppA